MHMVYRMYAVILWALPSPQISVTIESSQELFLRISRHYKDPKFGIL